MKATYEGYTFQLSEKVNRTKVTFRNRFISSLIECGININTVRSLAGHEDETTTLNNYCFNTNEETEMELENARNVRIAL